MLRYLHESLTNIGLTLKLLTTLGTQIMSKLDDLKADFADYQSKVTTEIGNLQTQLAGLQGQPQGVSDADLQTVIDSVDAAKAKLSPVVATPATPAPSVAPAPAASPAPVTPAPATPAS